MTKEEQGKKMGEIIAKAWADEEFKKRLLTDATAVLREEGMEVPDGVEVRVVENTGQVFNVVLPKKPEAQELSDDQLEGVAGGMFECPVMEFGKGCLLRRWGRG
jgi:hypothetical protein